MKIDWNIFFLKNIVLQLQNGIFTSGIPPILLPDEFFESLMYTFSETKSLPKKDTSHMYKTLKNVWKFQISIFLEKPIPKLSFDIGFTKIHPLARFLSYFEVCWFSGFWISHLVSLRNLYREIQDIREIWKLRFEF